MVMINTNDIKNMDDRYRVHFINSLSGFKSANLIGSVSARNECNLCIVSSVVHLGANPPLMAYINRPHSVPRHTLENILETRRYTINHVSQEIISESHQSSARYDKSQSEFTECNLEDCWINGFDAPFVKASRLKIGLEYREHHTLLNGTVMVIGEVVLVELEDQALQPDGWIDIESLETVAVSGLDAYHTTNKVKRMAYAKPDQPSKEIMNVD